MVNRKALNAALFFWGLWFTGMLPLAILMEVFGGITMPWHLIVGVDIILGLLMAILLWGITQGSTPPRI